MSKNKFKILFISPVLLLTLFVGVCINRVFSDEPSHIWFELNTAKVTVNSQAFGGAHIYRSPDGQLLVNLKQYGEGYYLIKPEKQFIGSPNSANFLEFPGFIYCKQLMPYASPAGKFETEPELKVHGKEIEFIARKDISVTILW